MGNARLDTNILTIRMPLCTSYLILSTMLRYIVICLLHKELPQVWGLNFVVHDKKMLEAQISQFNFASQKVIFILWERSKILTFGFKYFTFPAMFYCTYLSFLTFTLFFFLQFKWIKWYLISSGLSSTQSSWSLPAIAALHTQEHDKGVLKGIHQKIKKTFPWFSFVVCLPYTHIHFSRTLCTQVLTLYAHLASYKNVLHFILAVTLINSWWSL